MGFVVGRLLFGSRGICGVYPLFFIRIYPIGADIKFSRAVWAPAAIVLVRFGFKVGGAGHDVRTIVDFREVVHGHFPSNRFWFLFISFVEIPEFDVDFFEVRVAHEGSHCVSESLLSMFDFVAP